MGWLLKFEFIAEWRRSLLLRAGSDQVESELSERKIEKAMKVRARRLAECVNPGSEELRLVFVATRCDSSRQDVIPRFLFREIWKPLPGEDDLADEMAAQSGSSGSDNLLANGEVDVEWRAVVWRCAQLAREIARCSFVGRGGGS